MRIEKTVSIHTTPNSLWNWITEFEKLQEWNPSIVKEEPVSGDPGRAGFKSRVLIQEGGKQNWYDSVITTFDAPNLLKMEMTGGNLGESVMYIEYHLTAIEGTVTLRYVSSWTPVGVLMRLLHPFIKVMARRNAEAAVTALKEKAEAIAV